MSQPLIRDEDTVFAQMPSRLPSNVPEPTGRKGAFPANSYSQSGGGRGIRTPEGLHLSGFQARSPLVRQRSRTFASVRAVFHVGTLRPPTFTNVRHRSPRLPSPLPSPAASRFRLASGP